jgi:hypothetical protein
MIGLRLPSLFVSHILSDMRTTLRTFQRNFAAMRARAEAGATVEIEANGKTRYVFTLAKRTKPQRLSTLLASATCDIEIQRDKSPMRSL